MADEYAYQVRPLYNYSEADRLAGVSSGTSKRWLEGYKYLHIDKGYVYRPAISSVAGLHALGAVSFVDLVEVYAIGQLRQWFSPQRIRDIVSDCAEIFGTPYPLASHKFETDGHEIFVVKEGRLVGLLGHRWETAWHEMLEPFLQQLDYRGELASRWRPFAGIMIDPEYGFGLPVIEGTGFRTEIIAERAEHELFEEIAKDLEVKVIDIQHAIQFELTRRKAA